MKDWLGYFKQNKQARITLDWSRELIVDDSLRHPLLKTLQCFQIGETGEGEHLLNYANKIKNADYIACIELFIEEEQEHARLLAQAIQSLGSSPIQSHWAQTAFFILRRLGKLESEILILLIGEIIGLNFYAIARDNVKDPTLTKMFYQITHDEFGHTKFHSLYLSHFFSQLPNIKQNLIAYIWRIIFIGAALVFSIDNRQTLKNLNTSPISFFKTCLLFFNQNCKKIFSQLFTCTVEKVYGQE
jgi:rubrerythrin